MSPSRTEINADVNHLQSPHVDHVLGTKRAETEDAPQQAGGKGEARREVHRR